MSLSAPNTAATTAAAAFEPMEASNVAATTQVTAAGAAATQAAAAPAAAAAATQEGVGLAATAAAAQEAQAAAAAPAQEAQAAQVTEAQALAVNTDSRTQLAQAASRTMALAVPQAGSPAALIAQSNPVNFMQNVMPVTWEDFTAIGANQGSFMVKGGDSLKEVGKALVLKLISWQDQFISAPLDDQKEAAQGDVAYSDDGVHINGDGVTVELDGEEVTYTTIKEHQTYLKSIAKPGKVSNRAVLVGELISAKDGEIQNENALEYIGNLVQVVLSEAARRKFESHGKLAGYHISQGRLTQDDANYVELKCKMAGTGKKQFTMVETNYAPGHKPRAEGQLPNGLV